MAEGRLKGYVSVIALSRNRFFAKKSPTHHCDHNLVVACAGGAAAEVCRLMEITDASKCDTDGVYPLTAAIKEGQWGIVEILLENSRIEVNVEDACGLSPLILCIENADKKASKHGSAIVCLGKLLEHGARLDVQDLSGRGAIEIALNQRQGQMALMLIQSFKMLIDSEADRQKSQVTSWNLTISNIRAIDLPQMNSKGSADVFGKISVGEAMHQTRVMRNSLCPEWTESCEFEVCSSSMQYLVFQLYRWDRSGHDELLCEVSIPLVDSQRYPKQKIDRQFSLNPSKSIRTSGPHIARVQFSVHSSYPFTNVETAKSLVNSSQLVLASLLDPPDALSCMQMLLSLGAAVNDRDATGVSPLTYVLRGGRMELTSCLLNAKADPNHLSEEGNAAWSTVASMSGSKETKLALSEMLLAHGIRPNSPLMFEGQWQTPLTFAVRTGHDAMLALILRHAGDPNLNVQTALAQMDIQTEEVSARLHPLCLAMQDGNIHIFRFLLDEQSLNFDLVWGPGGTEDAAEIAEALPPVAFACLRHYDEHLRMLLGHPQSSAKLEDAGNAAQALRMAARSDSMRCVRLLVHYLPGIGKVELLYPAILEAIRNASSSFLVFCFHILSASHRPSPDPADIFAARLAEIKGDEKQDSQIAEGGPGEHLPTSVTLPSIQPLALEDLEGTFAGGGERSKNPISGGREAEEGAENLTISKRVVQLFDPNQVKSMLMEAIPFSSLLLWLLRLFAIDEKKTPEILLEVCHSAIFQRCWSSVEVLLKLQARRDDVSSFSFTLQLVAVLSNFSDMQASSPSSLANEGSMQEFDEHVRSIFLIFRTSPAHKLELELEAAGKRTMLHFASHLGWLPVVERLTELGASSVSDEDGNEPAALAAMNFHEKVCERLVQRFCPCRVSIHWSANALLPMYEQHDDLLSFSVARGWTGVARMLVASLIKRLNNRERSTGGQAEGGGDDEEEGKRQEAEAAELRVHVRLAVRMAAEHGWLEGLSLVLTAFPSEQEEWNQHDELPLLALAAVGGHADCVKFLVQQETSGVPLALIASSIRGNLPVTSFLFDSCEQHDRASRTDVRLKQLRSLKDLALLLSSLRGSLEVSTFLLSQGADPNHRANIPHEILRWMNCEDEYPTLVGLEQVSEKSRFLLVDVDTIASPMMMASFANSLELSTRLLEARAEIDAMQADAMAPLTAAAIHGNHEILVFLIKRGATLDTQKKRIMNILEFGKVRRLWQRLVMACLKAGKFSKFMSENAKSTTFVPPSTGSFATEKSFGAKMKYYAATPLLWSILRKNDECSRILIECGADHALVKEFFESDTLSGVLHHNIDPVTRHELQDKIEGLTDYALAAAVSVPPTFSRDALRSTAAGMEADEQGTRVFDLYHVEGNKNLVPSNRRLQAVRIDVGWHDRSLKNIHFLWGISASELEDMQFWTHKPKNGSLFFVVVPHDAHVQEMEFLIGKKRIFAVRLTLVSDSGVKRKTSWYGQADETETDTAIVKTENRELVGAQVIYGSLDSTCIKSIRVYSRLRYPHEYLRSYRQDAMADPDCRDVLSLDKESISRILSKEHSTRKIRASKRILFLSQRRPYSAARIDQPPEDDEEVQPDGQDSRPERPRSVMGSASLRTLDHDRVLRVYCVRRNSEVKSRSDVTSTTSAASKTLRLSVQKRPLIPHFKPLLSSNQEKSFVERLAVEDILERAKQKA